MRTISCMKIHLAEKFLTLRSCKNNEAFIYSVLVCFALDWVFFMFHDHYVTCYVSLLNCSARLTFSIKYIASSMSYQNHCKC